MRSLISPCIDRGRSWPDAPARVCFESLEGRVMLSSTPSPWDDLSFVDLLDPSVNLPVQLTTPSGTPRINNAPAADILSAFGTGTVFTPLTAGQFTTALNSAQRGDTIILQAGVTYVGAFVLPNKTSGSGFISIVSSNLASLPGPGVRISPADAVHMPRLQSAGSNQAVIRTAASANHYQFIGIEFVGPANNTNLTTLVELGRSTTDQTTLDVVPHNIHIDRSYLRPNTPGAHIRRAIALHSANSDVTNSYIEEIHEPGSDSQAIAGWNGPGPYNIINNRLEGASENIMFGGSTTRIPGMVPSDIVIRGNHIVKPLHWRPLNYNVKNLFELKHGVRVLLEGNILENNWTQGQTGVAVVLKLGDRDTTPWNVTEDIVLVNNIIRHANGGVSLQGRDYASGAADPGGNVRRISIVNNVFDDINGKWGTSGTGGGTFFIYVTQGPKDVTFNHNTMFNGYTTIEVDTSNGTYRATGFRFLNNIAAHNQYGVRSPSGIGNPTFNTYFTDAGHAFVANVMMGGNSNNYTARPGNFFPANWGVVQFVDQAGGNYRLAEASPYRNAGTDGKDLGANFDALDFAVRGVLNGIWTSLVEIVATDFSWQSAPHRAMVHFSADVGASLTQANFTVQNMTTGTAVPQDKWTLSYLADVDAAVLTFDGYPNGILPDGNYRITVHAAGIRDGGDGVMAGDESFVFFYLAGDANRDAKVTIADLGILAANWQQPALGPQYGDFNYDGIVNIADLGILAGNWQADLNAPVLGVLLAYDGFSYPAGGLSGNGGSEGWGGVWTTQASRENANVTAGTMTYSDGTLSLLTSGNKVTTTGNSRNWRVLNSPLAVNQATPELWISFIARANSTGSGHVGIALADGSEAAEIVTLGKGASVPNWGFAGIANSAQSSTAATTEAFLVYQFVYGPDGTATARLWVNPSLAGPPTGAPAATTTLSNFSFDRIRVSSASGNFGDIDELRVGTSFASVAPYAMPSLSVALAMYEQNEPESMPQQPQPDSATADQQPQTPVAPSSNGRGSKAPVWATPGGAVAPGNGSSGRLAELFSSDRISLEMVEEGPLELKTKQKR
jgi:hypothetical protein